jgi:hypothetical protein
MSKVVHNINEVEKPEQQKQVKEKASWSYWFLKGN